jgi:hypothetical protein
MPKPLAILSRSLLLTGWIAGMLASFYILVLELIFNAFVTVQLVRNAGIHIIQLVSYFFAQAHHHPSDSLSPVLFAFLSALHGYCQAPGFAQRWNGTHHCPFFPAPTVALLRMHFGIQHFIILPHQLILSVIGSFGLGINFV